MAGLAARDTLRIEAGLNLYNHEISELTSPLESGMKWTLGPRYLASKNSKAAELLSDMIKDSRQVKTKLVGFVWPGGPPARGGEPVMLQGASVGVITSGTYSPNFGKFIAIARIEKSTPSAGSKFSIAIRDTVVNVEMWPM